MIPSVSVQSHLHRAYCDENEINALALDNQRQFQSHNYNVDEEKEILQCNFFRAILEMVICVWHNSSVARVHSEGMSEKNRNNNNNNNEDK